ncbi:AAA family ATPase [Candidatus Bathyarchaeota archaeon]|nr:AAA family ATPase [Candidatus Bathyarchaeota archaeon]
MTASYELEELASKYANEAIRFDRQGLKGTALAKYQRAVEILLKLCSLYPSASQNKVYLRLIEQYEHRINQLQGLETYVEPAKKAKETEFEDLDQLVLREKPNVKWKDIAGLEDAKRAITESIIYPVQRPDLFPLGWPRGILLFGPPGCGKTLLAAAVATEIDANFYCIDSASIMSKWLGESEKNVAYFFKKAKQALEKGRPSIIFMDEIDSLVGIRRDEVGGEVRTRNQFLKEMDNVVDKTKKLHIYVIGATNKPWALDEAFIRRFQKRILVPVPDYYTRLEMIKIFSKGLNISKKLDFDEVASMAEGYSGSDIRDIFQSIQIKIVRELFENNNVNANLKLRTITMDDFKVVFKERKPSVSKDMLRYYEKWHGAFKAL